MIPAEYIFLVVRRLLRRVQRERATSLARRRTAAGLCFECGRPVPEGLLRLGSLRCHDCGGGARSLTPADLTAAGLG